MSFIYVDGLRKTKELSNSEHLEEVESKRKKKTKYEMKQLDGKRIYLDLPNLSRKKLEQLRGDLELFGAEVCDFLSKDVSHLITTRMDAYQADNVAMASNVSTPSPANISTPSPFQTKSSASHPRSSWVQSPQETDSPASCEMKKPFPPFYNTRGQCFVQKAVATNHQGSSNLIATARKFNVKVRTLDKVLKWIESRKLMSEKQAIPQHKTTDMKTKSRCSPSTLKVRPLKSPFIKVEDVSRMYRPQFLCFDHWPFINFDAHLGVSPFDVREKDSNSRHRQGTRVDKQHAKGYRKRRGYCECCLEEFDDLSGHLKSKQHVEFATNEGNYVDVDQCIGEGVTFEEFLAKQGNGDEEGQTRSWSVDMVETSLVESEDDVKLISIRTGEWSDVCVRDNIHTQLYQPNDTHRCDLHDQLQPTVGNTNDGQTEREQESILKKRDSQDSKTSDTFHGFTNFEISRTLEKLRLYSPNSSQQTAITKTPQKSTKTLKRELEHPQSKYLNRGLTNQEQELTMLTLTTGEKNLRSRTANLLASRQQASSPIRVTRKRKRNNLVSDESSLSLMHFKASPTWRRPRRKQRSRNGLLAHNR